MNDPQIKRESSDTFGRNPSADLELLRRVAEHEERRSEQMLAMAVIAAAVATVLGVAGVMLYAVL
jgi:hypothetical protein